MDHLGDNELFMDFGDQSMAAFDMAPGHEGGTNMEKVVPMASMDQQRSRDDDNDTIQTLLRFVLSNQLKLNEQLTNLQEKLERKMDEQSERLDKQETCLLERSQMILERLNDCLGMLDPLHGPTYSESEYSCDSLDGPTYAETESSQDSDYGSDAFPCPGGCSLCEMFSQLLKVGVAHRLDWDNIAPTMNNRDKELPPTPLRISQPQMPGHSDAKFDPLMYCGAACNAREKKSEELREANRRLQQQVHQLAVENNNLLAWKTQAEKEIEHHQETIEIQKGALKNIMAYAVITVQDCRMNVKQKQIEREQSDAGTSLPMGTDTSMI
ncbi:hypothetical protein FDECE_12012 [Fusarium decemcellulare]|nr:hypothetical protein FDECE_12012 [Fusarium decemcellulare]